MKNKYIENLIIILLVLVIILVASKIAYIFEPISHVLLMFIGPIIIGGFIYYWLRPINRKLSQGRLNKYKGLTSALTIIFFVSIFVVIISSAGVKLSQQFQDTVKNFLDKDSGYLAMVENNLEKLNIDLTYLKKYEGQIKQAFKNLVNSIPRIFSGIGDFGTQLALLPFILFYLLKEEEQIDFRLKKSLPKAYKKEGGVLLDRLDQVLSTYIVGQLLVALIIGGLMFIGYLIIKMPNALLMASFSVITAVIPFIGAFLGILPALLISLTIGLNMFIKVIILAIIVQQLEGNLITPNLMGNRLNIHPFIVMVVVIISVNLLGVFGAFIGIPLYLVISILLKAFIKIKHDKKEAK